MVKKKKYIVKFWTSLSGSQNYSVSSLELAQQYFLILLFLYSQGDIVVMSVDFLCMPISGLSEGHKQSVVHSQRTWHRAKEASNPSTKNKYVEIGIDNTTGYLPKIPVPPKSIQGALSVRQS